MGTHQCNESAYVYLHLPIKHIHGLQRPWAGFTFSSKNNKSNVLHFKQTRIFRNRRIFFKLLKFRFIQPVYILFTYSCTLTKSKCIKEIINRLPLVLSTLRNVKYMYIIRTKHRQDVASKPEGVSSHYNSKRGNENCTKQSLLTQLLPVCKILTKAFGFLINPQLLLKVSIYRLTFRTFSYRNVTRKM